MLTKRIIPCLDIKDGRVVKGVNFVGIRDAGDPVEAAVMYNEAGADELVLLDILASHEGRKTIFDVVSSVAEQVFIPFTVGGGISSLDTMKELLRLGADKISVNSPAVRDPSIISRAADKFGSQCVVVAMDVRRVEGTDDWSVFVNGGRVDTGMDAVRWAVRAAELGAGEILLTSMNTDGAQTGYDIPITRKIADAVPIPIIASGGAGKLRHFAEALTDGRADAALAASLFHDKVMTVRQVKEYLSQNNIPVRIL
ncbi:MAG: imidazole glycerol phosphate synthase subunit HisF [Oscillospiraceae bacterium]|jgi:cyclase|nr:imidazole glycerol phosphate synthase subunit HisF [Oscillospiraceae bacterium]